MSVEVTLADPRWAALDLPALAVRAIGAALAELGLDPEPAEISLLACDDLRIADLNAEFRAKPAPTNVLSWPAQDLTPPDLPDPDPDGSLPLGDIALAFETCEREAAEQGKPVTDHVTHLIVHGTLHLLGYDHLSDAEATLMEGLEVSILGKLGVGDPYS